MIEDRRGLGFAGVASGSPLPFRCADTRSLGILDLLCAPLLPACLAKRQQRLRFSGHARALPIRYQVLKVLRFGHELLSEIAVTVAAGMQRSPDFNSRITSVIAHSSNSDGIHELVLLLAGFRHHKRPPRLAHEGEIEPRSGFQTSRLLSDM